ncbi:hypothetical protein GCM10010168_22030 [Actinoplanes ianthinogenes]|uniref:Lipoprotein n=1 Tax=Actinoplanes ianthinogenes TaxID=122358 RepID=A0ABM7M875_9ACTN|nr:hypothetical protein [Actinoplanes ianthinogenes]BCJ47844.1 hypothetical protein Aiant_85010 [Actinoplanes ianthinogenes]GGR04549.1 hypothetical protein GCM10010168_22030 [Actinoplanes ianthinogenes]
MAHEETRVDHVAATRRLLVVALLTALGCAGCDTKPIEPAEPVDPRPAGTAPLVRFSATVQAGETSVHVRYALDNTSGEPLMVINRVPIYTARPPNEPDPAAVYVVGSTPPGRVQIAERAFPRPDTDRMNWVATPTVGATVVRPGGAVSEEFDVPLPLTRRHPYGDNFGDGTIPLPDPVTEVVFCLGVVRHADLAGHAVRGEGPEITLPHLASVTDVQHLFCSDPARL